MTDKFKICIFVAILSQFLASCSPDRKHMRYQTLNKLKDLGASGSGKESNKKSSEEGNRPQDPSEVFINEVYLLYTGQTMPESLDSITIAQLKDQGVGLLGLVSGLMKTTAYKETIVARTLMCLAGRVSSSDLKSWVEIYDDSAIQNLTHFLTIFFAAKTTHDWLSLKYQSPKSFAAAMISAVGCITIPWGDQPLWDGLSAKIRAEDLAVIESVVEGEQFAFPFVAIALAPFIRSELAKYGSKTVALSLSGSNNSSNLVEQYLGKDDFGRAYAASLSSNTLCPLANDVDPRQEITITDTPALAPESLAQVDSGRSFFEIDGPSIIAPNTASFALFAMSGAMPAASGDSGQDWNEENSTSDDAMITDPGSTDLTGSIGIDGTGSRQGNGNENAAANEFSSDTKSGALAKSQAVADGESIKAKKLSDNSKNAFKWKQIPKIAHILTLKFNVVDRVEAFSSVGTLASLDEQD